MEFPNALKIMIAKTCNGRSDLWLPVWIHLTDTAGIIRLLVTQRYANLSEIAGTDADKMEKTAVLAALLHDIAKITPLFQAKLLQFLPDRAGAFEKYFLPIAPYGAFVNASNSPHNFAGEAILLKLGFPADFASVIGAHHGKPADNGAVQTNIEDFPSNYYGVKHTPERWEELWRQWTQYALTTSGFTGADEIPALTKRAQVLLSGLLVTADWISSNREYFPLIPADETPGEADYPPDRIENAWNKAGFPGLWEPMWTSLSPDQFNAQFGFSPNSVQKRMLEITASCENPGMFILEAPMGTGKTEAALACAELLAHKCKKTGIFFGLPTQSTANGIFPRIRDWASEQSFENFDDIYSINLVHKNAGFVPAFRDIPGESSLDGDGDSNLVAHSFFSGRKQSCLSDFVVATVDQLLMAALKRKHNMLTHLGLSQKVVIIDECHAYDAYMNRYLDRALEWLSAYGVPVILLSATLPERRRRELIAAYLRGAPALETKAAAGNEYPLLSWTDGEKAYREAISYDGDTHTVEIIRGTDDEACAQAEKAAAAGGCVGIITNSVVRAQGFAERLSKTEGARIILFHAQYIMPDRMAKETELLKTIGKKSDCAERSGVIVAGTQVLEQSLDIDFDFLITDLCPMDLLLQRIGRLHRHKRGFRPEGFKQARCMVLNCGDKFENAAEAIYGGWLLTRTQKLLPGEIAIPADIAQLVQGTYAHWSENEPEIKSKWDEYAGLIEEKERRAESFRLAAPQESRRNNTLHGWLTCGVHDGNAEATVRDGISSLEALVMAKGESGAITFLPWQSEGESFSGGSCPDDEACRKIARQRIRLPSLLCKPWSINKTIMDIELADGGLAVWQSSHWLAGELILLLDKDFSAVVNGYRLTYKQETGLTYKKEEK